MSRKSWFIRGVALVLDAVRPEHPEFIAELVALYRERSACSTWSESEAERATWVQIATLRGLSVGTPEQFDWLQSFDDAEQVQVMTFALQSVARLEGWRAKNNNVEKPMDESAFKTAP